MSWPARVGEQSVPRSAVGEVAGPAWVADVGEAEFGRIGYGLVEQIVGVKVVNLEASGFEPAEIAEHGRVERLREVARQGLNVQRGARIVEAGGEAKIWDFIEEKVARAERERRIDRVDGVGLGFSDDAADHAEADLARFEFAERVDDVVAADVDSVERARLRPSVKGGVGRHSPNRSPGLTPSIAVGPVAPP